VPELAAMVPRKHSSTRPMNIAAFTRAPAIDEKYCVAQLPLPLTEPAMWRCGRDMNNSCNGIHATDS
jgi:hypothetical protein